MRGLNPNPPIEGLLLVAGTLNFTPAATTGAVLAPLVARSTVRVAPTTPAPILVVDALGVAATTAEVA